MESRIEELKQKYWEGTTSLEEEAELKMHFANNSTMGVEARYFATLQKANKRGVPDFVHPGQRTKRMWMAVAASVMIGTATLTLLIKTNESKDPFLVEDPQEAYELTKNAMMMMSTGLNQGTVATTELKKINKAEEILTTN
jgi:hypothetical protein